MKKKLIIFIVIICLIFFIIFLKNNYKNLRIGNNRNNKSVQETEEYILNIKSYIATMDVTIQSNKNQNKYLLKQEHTSNQDKQTVMKPENIEGIEIVYNDGKLEINNSNYNLTKIYSNYPYISDNSLWLSSFIEEYKNKDNKPEIYEENGDIVMKIRKGSRYCNVKKLYIEKGTGRPKKMIIQDDNNSDTIYILYNEIDIF